QSFLPGDSIDDRLAVLLQDRAQLPERVATLNARLESFFERAVPIIRARFGGRVTYASIPLERVDWTLFDIHAVDLYRSADIADRFTEGVRNVVQQGQTVAITEFGTAAYRDAGDRGAHVLDVVEFDTRSGAPLQLNGVYERDEPGQAIYVRELLEVFDNE